ncbi:bacteriophage abortive infection AbiH family protein [Streptococcus suis]|uniref:bacteriophage abortive infection AbiH family protein n=1 Tax=Streptococcus suis TaxID=1307 RepID=UPI00211CD788|nr:bacteriophage abortive infection AbiH family protein [Streptococcus suis]MCQ9226025.1 bacteriophage abortive infection AbiH family protein [Streptococcus suis]MCQ9228343.1 bacteriophage abortive infection AbiH family protein [Streptococcus suis]MCQ9241307.1 bacteriophage abortive infection AbiH family protein [Streptococcus suis]MCQ9274554.1 bacteriophage abortive infection AbiH family protein [Streptococcus suis]MDE7535564.1 bacteriophage abortive infection AbiH family protein [Streptococc
MGYRDYSKNDFQKLEGQINIMALFGNGVDIQLMDYLNSPYRTTYQNFYNYLCYKNFDSSNLIFQKMRNDYAIYCQKRGAEKRNWSDFENSLIDIFNETQSLDIEKLEHDFKVFQIEFSNFLNDIITPQDLAKLGTSSSNEQLAVKTFQEFLGDLSASDYRKLKFPSKLGHYQLFNWEILNFNYTSLLNNILTLDKEQYDPHQHIVSDSQIWFQVNPNNFSNDFISWNSSTYFSTYLMTNIDHPHGYQNVPKSMLFGFDNENQIINAFNRNFAKQFLKPYWAQNDKKYKSYFNDTDLFIIYGLSLGVTDFWWWQNILNALLETDAELIIYNFQTPELDTDVAVINKFITSAYSGLLSEESRNKLHQKISVVQYTSETKLRAFKLTRD